MKHKELCYSREIVLENTELLLGETLFHNANGYIGVRGTFEEGYPEGYTSIRGQYINGFYDITDMKQAEALCGLIEEKQTMLNVADTQGIWIEIGREVFSLFEGEIKQADRYVDMEKGVTGRRIRWKSPNGYEISLEFLRMTSFIRLPLFFQQVRITSHNYSGPVRIRSVHKGEVRNFCDPTDPRVADVSIQYLKVKEASISGHKSYIIAETSRSGLEVCSGVCHRIPDEYLEKVEIDESDAIHIITGNISCGETCFFWKYSWFSDSVRNEHPLRAVEEGLDLVCQIPVEKLFQEQQEYLKKFWEKSSLEIGGDTELNQAVHFNQYTLLQSAARDSFGNMAAKGLSGEGYEGHYFWDTEIYAVPSFVLMYPEIARNLLEYRYRTLGKAKENAKALGHHAGALYPWRTINGEECSGYFPSGTAAYHISGDVAYAVTIYYMATEDLEFLCGQGAELIVETARLWLDTGNYVGDTFQIQDVTGPDEYTCMVNNNYYTNALAKYNLEWVAKCREILTEAGEWETFRERLGLTQRELDEFEKAAACMMLPYDRELDINPQDDSFLMKKKWDFSDTPTEKKPLLLHYHPLALYRRQVCKQADTVLSHFMFEDYQKLSTIRNSFLYYEKITTHDSSLSTCIFSIEAARLGMIAKAYHYFGDSAKMDLFNTHKNTKDGIHTANMAGTYMAVIYGFAGLRIRENGILLSPCIPEEWKYYRFRFACRKALVDVWIDHVKCRITLLEGPSLAVYVNGQKYILEDRIITDVRREGEVWDIRA